VLQTNPTPFRLDSLWGATLMPLRACAMDWGRNRILRVDKTPVLFYAVCGPKFTKFWDHVWEPSFPMPLSDCFVPKIFVIKSRSRRKPNKCKNYWTQFLGKNDPDFFTADC